MSSTCRVSATSWARKTRAPCQAQTAVAASVPVSRSSTGRSRVSPTKSLLDSATSTGQPVATISSSRRVSSRECQVFLPKSCAGSISDAARGRTPGGDRPLGAAPSSSAIDVGDHVVVRDPVRVGCAAAAPPVCVQTMPGAVLGGDLGQLRVGAAPGVVEQVGAGRAAPPRDRGPPGVDADHQRRGSAARTAATKSTVRRISSATSTSSPGPALTPPMSTMSAPSATTRSTALERGRLGVGGAAVVERVRGAVDDRHHRGRVVGEVPVPSRSVTQPPPTPAGSRSQQRPTPPTRCGATTAKRGTIDAVIWFWVVVLVLVIGAVAVLAAGRDDSMPEAYEDRPDHTIPAGRATDLRRPAAGSLLQRPAGYRMDEVDALIDRIAADLVAREADERPATPGPEDTSSPAARLDLTGYPATTSTESSATADDPSAEDTSGDDHDERTVEPDSPDESTRHRDAGSAGAAHRFDAALGRE